MLTMYWYQLKQRTLRDDVTIEEIPKLLKDNKGVLWCDFSDPTEEEVAYLSTIFDFHPLCIEDCVHRQDIPKLEEFPEYLFLVVHGLQLKTSDGYPSGVPCELAELNLFFGKNFVVTVHQKSQQAIEFVREHVLRGTSALYGGASMFAHEILDALVDLYMPILEKLDTRLEELEDVIEENPASDIVKDFFDLRRDILKIRRISLREQEVFYWLSHRDISFITPKEALLFRDVYDHLVRVVELSESARDILSGILHIHLSLMSNRMNDIMRILTIFSAILLPLTFVVGIYGMNFEYMPELRHPLGYYSVLAVLALITVVLLGYFKHKKWI